MCVNDFTFFYLNISSIYVLTLFFLYQFFIFVFYVWERFSMCDKTLQFLKSINLMSKRIFFGFYKKKYVFKNINVSYFKHILGTIFRSRNVDAYCFEKFYLIKLFYNKSLKFFISIIKLKEIREFDIFIFIELIKLIMNYKLHQTKKYLDLIRST